MPGLRPGWDRGLSEPTCADIDVAAAARRLSQARARAGAELVTGARVEAAERGGGRWRIETRAGAFEAGILVDAAGAWADEVAALAGERPLGIRP